MQEINVDHWEDLLSAIENLQETRKNIGRTSGASTSQFLYRGQADAEWKLRSTLEIQVALPYRFDDYFRLVANVHPQIETFTGRHWPIPTLSELEAWASDYDNLKKTKFPGYEFLIYLRHHRFPSPLLDWTASPYIAAYFAFEQSVENRSAIWIYWEGTGQGKDASKLKPQIQSFGHNVRSHPRHFNQQSAYTVSARFQNGAWHYVAYEQTSSRTEEKSQDRLYKLTVPTSERLKVLSILDSMNVNALSLFNNEEALVQTLAIRELHLAGYEP